MKLTPRRMLRQFVSTFTEWHYFVGGAALGFFLGAEYARRYHGEQHHHQEDDHK